MEFGFLRHFRSEMRIDDYDAHRIYDGVPKTFRRYTHVTSSLPWFDVTLKRMCVASATSCIANASDGRGSSTSYSNRPLWLL